MDILVARDFHPRPFGRGPEHSEDANGQKFRQEHLVPALLRGERVVVDFGGTGAVAPSFLEEAFGGLIEQGFDEGTLKRLLVVRFPNNPEREAEVWEKIAIAARKHRVLAH